MYRAAKRRKASKKDKPSNKNNSETNNVSESDYRQNFFAVFRKVFDGSLPFEELLGHVIYKRRGCKICAHFAPKQHAEDLFQELSLKVYLNIHKLGGISSEEQFFAWASKVAHNLSIDMFRKKSRQGEIDDTPVEDHSICDLSAPNPYLECAVEEWIASLSPLRRRELQIKIENPGISTREIAKLLAKEGIKRSHAAVAKDLKESLDSYLETPEEVGSQKTSHVKKPRRNGGQSRSEELGHDHKKTNHPRRNTSRGTI